MQMIDVLKRLAELDAQNPNIVKENQSGKIGTMGLDAFPDELDRMRATRTKMDSDTEWLLKNKPTDPCPKCGEDTTYRSSFGTTQELKCARCGKVRLSSDDRKEYQDMAEGSLASRWENDPTKPAHWTLGHEPDPDYVYSIYRDGEKEGTYHSLDQAKQILANIKRSAPHRKYKITRHTRSKMVGPKGVLPEEQGVAEEDHLEISKDIVSFIDNELESGAAYEQAVIAASSEFDMDPTKVDSIYRKNSTDSDAIPSINFGLNESLKECGMMGSDMGRPRTPASINMTADSGEELTGMLRGIMQLAGVKPVGQDDLGHEHEPAVISAEPSLGMAKMDGGPLDMKSMIATMDTLNDPEGDDIDMPNDDDMPVKEWDNEPVEDLDGNMGNDAMLNTGMHNHDQSGGEHAAKGRNFKNNPVAYPETMYENLMAEYRKFVSESQKKNLSEIQGSRSIEKPNRTKSADDDQDYDLTDKDAPYYVGWSGQSLEWYGDEDPSTGQGRYKPKGDGGRIVAINVKDKEDAEKLANQLDDAYRVGNFEDDAVYGKYGQDGYLVNYSGAYVIPMSKMDSYDREMLKYDMKAGRVKDYS